MAEYSKHQKKIIDRYYDNRDAIMLTKLQEIVTELYLATTEATKKKLWKQAAAAMKNLNVPSSVADHLLDRQKPELLAENLRNWLNRPTQPPPRTRPR